MYKMLNVNNSAKEKISFINPKSAIPSYTC